VFGTKIISGDKNIALPGFEWAAPICSVQRNAVHQSEAETPDGVGRANTIEKEDVGKSSKFQYPGPGRGGRAMEMWKTLTASINFVATK